MNCIRPACALAAAVLLLAALPAGAAGPAARQGDPSSHATSFITEGSPDVLIDGLPAARQNDWVSCGEVDPVPHVGGYISGGSGTVLINGRPAARQGDGVAEPVTSVIAAGSTTVLTGD